MWAGVVERWLSVGIRLIHRRESSVCFVKCRHYLSILLISLSKHFRKLQISSLESLVLCGIRFFLTGSVVEVISELISVLLVIALCSRFTITDLVLLHDFRLV